MYTWPLACNMAKDPLRPTPKQMLALLEMIADTAAISYEEQKMLWFTIGYYGIGSDGEE